jgi:hypothetical protein
MNISFYLFSEETSIVHNYYAPDTVVAQVRELRHSKFETISKHKSKFISFSDPVGFLVTKESMKKD